MAWGARHLISTQARCDLEGLRHATTSAHGGRRHRLKCSWRHDGDTAAKARPRVARAGPAGRRRLPQKKASGCDDLGVGEVRGPRRISASRRVEAPSRHRRASSPGEEAVRTDLTEMLRAGHGARVPLSCCFPHLPMARPPPRLRLRGPRRKSNLFLAGAGRRTTSEEAHDGRLGAGWFGRRAGCSPGAGARASVKAGHASEAVFIQSAGEEEVPRGRRGVAASHRRRHAAHKNVMFALLGASRPRGLRDRTPAPPPPSYAVAPSVSSEATTTRPGEQAGRRNPRAAAGAHRGPPRGSDVFDKTRTRLHSAHAPMQPMRQRST
jgi:hypothetical protein